MGRFSDDLSKRLREKPEDKDLARQAVERDRQRAVEIIADAAARNPAPGDDPPTAADGPPDIFNLEIGARHDLSQAAAERHGKEWREITVRLPNAYIIPHISGYDDDPRALCDFPAVRAYMQHWSEAAGIRTIDGLPDVSQDTIIFFATCGVFGPDMEVEARTEAQKRYGSNPTEQ